MLDRKKTKYIGVYEQVSSTKRFRGKPDVCYYITYRAAGKFVWEKVGWRSEGIDGFIAKNVRDERTLTLKTGEDPRPKKITLEDAWNNYFTKHIKDKSSAKTCEGLWRNYLAQPLGNIRLDEIKPVMLADISAQMKDEGKAPQTIKLALGLVKSIYKYIIMLEQYAGPVPNIAMPRIDNQRLRFLNPDEVRLLLEEMDKRSEQWGDICRMSLFAGLRLGEILSLKVGHVDIGAAVMHIMDAKAGTRSALISPTLMPVIAKKIAYKSSDMYVFAQSDGSKIKYISQTVPRVIQALGFNDGIDDARHKVVFHTLRHTFASWLAMKGTPLYVIAELMGHKTLEMTNRYKHLCPDQKQSAVAALGEFL